jgi:nicotinamide-nucleotide amidase
MPGVPSEMRNIFLEHVKPLLSDRFVLNPSRLVTIKTLGIGESDIQQRLDGIEVPAPVQLGFRAGIDEVQTKLLFPSGYPEAQMTLITTEIAARIGDFVFGIDGLAEEIGNLASVVDKLMTEAGKTLTVAENVSQGLLAAKCPGAAWLKSALFEQSLDALGQRFGLTLTGNDPADAGVKLAHALREQQAADFILVQLYEGGPARFRDQDRTIILYNALLTEDSCQQSSYHLGGPMGRKQNQAALLGLDLLRRHLQNRKF